MAHTALFAETTKVFRPVAPITLFVSVEEVLVTQHGWQPPITAPQTTFHSIALPEVILKVNRLVILLILEEQAKLTTAIPITIGDGWLP